MTTTPEPEAPRGGEQMLAVRAYVAAHPGCSKRAAAGAVAAAPIAPRTRRRSRIVGGYRIVDRAIKAGLIVAVRITGGKFKYSLRLPSDSAVADEAQAEPEPIQKDVSAVGKSIRSSESAYLRQHWAPEAPRGAI